MESVPRRYPVPIFPVDRSGAVKARTLEYFVMHGGWHRPDQVGRDPTADESLSSGSSEKVEMRLLRYTRAGLLKRRKRRSGRGFEYAITADGELRLIHLWERLGYLSSEGAKTEAAGALLRARLRLVVALLGRREREAQEELDRLV